jgi:hypothetical protein
MTDRRKQIGFSQRIQLEWLEKTVNLYLAGNCKAEIEVALQEYLNDKLSIGGQSKRGNREKAITILSKIWVTVPVGFESLRDEGLHLFRNVPKADHLAIHWGMAIAAYPFLMAVAASTGRLLGLQNSAAVAHIQRRVREKYGERETVSRAVRRVLRTFVDWGVLVEGSGRGVYIAAPPRQIYDPRMVAWLVEATLLAEGNGSQELKSILQSPAFFPFGLETMSADVLVHGSRLEIERHGLHNEIVVLRHRQTP